MSRLRAPLQNSSYKKQTHRTTQKHIKHPDATDIQNKTSICVFGFLLNLYSQFLKCFLHEMLGYRLCTVNDLHWGFKLVFRYSKHLLEKKFIIKYIYFLYPGHQNMIQNYRKVQKKSKFVKCGVKKI